jgi:hypothetical protein
VASGHYARAACARTITSLAFLSLFAVEMQSGFFLFNRMMDKFVGSVLTINTWIVFISI